MIFYLAFSVLNVFVYLTCCPFICISLGTNLPPIQTNSSQPPNVSTKPTGGVSLMRQQPTTLPTSSSAIGLIRSPNTGNSVGTTHIHLYFTSYIRKISIRSNTFMLFFYSIPKICYVQYYYE